MEDENSLSHGVTTRRWSGFGQTGTEKKFFNCACSVDIHGARNVSTGIFIIKSTIDNVEVDYLRIKVAVQQIVQLQQSVRGWRFNS